MRMLEPVEVSSRPWICSYGHASSHCGLPGSPMTDMLLWICPSHGGYAPARTSYDGYAPMDTILLNCGYASIKDWIFNFMGKDLIHNEKKMKPQSKCLYFL